MNGLGKNKSGVFLMELIIVVLFVSLALTVCVKVFVSGEKLSKKSYALTNAVIQAQNAANLIKNNFGDLEVLEKYYGLDKSEDNPTVYFDDKFEECSENDNYTYKMIIEQTKEESLIVSNIKLLSINEDESVYELETKVFAREGGNI